MDIAPRRRPLLCILLAIAACGCIATLTLADAGADPPADPASSDHLVVARIAAVSTAQPVALARLDGTGASDGADWTLPTVSSGSNNPFTLQGDSNAVGGVTRSADGRYVSMAGYTTAVGGSAASSAARVVARVNAVGDANTSTTLGTAFTTQNIRGAVTSDGSSFWITGNGNTSAPLGGLLYAPLGSTTPTVIVSRTVPVTSSNAALNNTRTGVIADGQVWFSSEKGTAGVYRTTGLPTAGQSPTMPLAFGSDGAGVISILLLKHNASAPTVDTMYVVRETQGIFKFSFDGSTWTNRGAIDPSTTAYAAVTGKVDADGHFRLYATKGTGAVNSVVTMTDAAAFDAAPAMSSQTTLATAAAGTVFRGIALAPVDPTLAVPGAPTGVGGTPGDGKVSLSWTAPSDPGGSPISGYRVTPFVAGVPQTPVLTGSTATSFDVTGLANGTAYTFTVAALNASGAGPASAMSAAVTPQAPGAPIPTIALSAPRLEGTAGDATTPTVDVTVAQTGTPASGLTVAATASSNPTVATVAGVSISGSGATRTVSVAPAGVGYADITLTVTGTDAKTASVVLHYAASAASSTPATSRFLTGASDASAAIDVGDGYVLVGDDENNVLRLYKADTSGAPVKTWDVTPQLGNPEEVDIEAAARVGSTVYWTGSMGNSKTGGLKPDRSTLFTTTLTGSGASTDLTVNGYYRGLRADLIAWDQAHGDHYGFAAGAASGQIPKSIGGFNVEGIEFAPGSTSTAYVGFRAPLSPATASGKAIIVPVTNVDQLATAGLNTTVHATFGTPIELDLGGLSIRDIRRNASGGYLILAGSWAAGGSYALYTWDGMPAHAPVRALTALPADDVTGEDPGAWEAIVATPDPLTNGAGVRLLMDNGSADFYGDGQAAKDLAPEWQKSRSEPFTLTLAQAPVATTGAASAITSGGAGLAGTVNPGSAATSYTFEYGPTLSFGSITPVSSAGAGSADVPEAASLTGLSANTTYYYRLVATSTVGTSFGTVRSFRTTGPAQPPVAITGAASAISNGGATLAGQVNPHGSPTAYTIEYGPTTAFGAITPVVALDDADALEPVSATLTGLAADTTYYFRTVATNAAGTSIGAVGVFSTGPGGAPIVVTGAATLVTATGATLTGTVDAHGSPTAYTFEYGPTNAFGFISAVDSAGSTDGANGYALPITGLAPGTQYRFRIVATNAGGTVTGSVGSFTTASGA